MDSNPKYIIFENDFGHLLPIIFSCILSHYEIKIPHMKPISAGFISVGMGGYLYPYGESVSLNLKSNPRDEKILNDLFNV